MTVPLRAYGQAAAEASAAADLMRIGVPLSATCSIKVRDETAGIRGDRCAHRLESSRPDSAPKYHAVHHGAPHIRNIARPWFPWRDASVNVERGASTLAGRKVTMATRQRISVLGATAAALLVVAPTGAAGTVVRDTVRAESATVLGDGRNLFVKVTYTCTTGNTLSVAVAQPPVKSGQRPLRVGAGLTTAKCDGRTYTLDVPVRPTGTFTGTWQKGRTAAVGAVISTVVQGKARLNASDSRQLLLR
ncbi:hypothetical protein Arub01_30290 [Actinomadura rubrobrunea]|uniref:Uncharacterized protein n=2 Tax=Actinomadura rubrobrunea TaxID=115335 RepID=A0A9W6PVT0_9ACTN|nr:hypothetical protein [Actinomadura rubrobrunea]GLW64785.1 hypothetical protein Arub01_30290 [Actinomadura rubrobrunea]